MGGLIASDLPCQVITFLLQNRVFALDLRAVQEVVLLPAFAPLLQAPDYIPGVINFRGTILPVIDLRRRLGLPSARYSVKTAVIICRLPNDPWGLIADEVLDILDLPMSAWAHLPEKLDEHRHKVLMGIAKLENGLIFVLDGVALIEGISSQPELLTGSEAALVTQVISAAEANPTLNLLTGGGSTSRSAPPAGEV